MSKAASIKDVNFSLKGEATQTTPFEQFEQLHLVSQEPIAPDSGRVILKLVDSTRKGGINVDGIDDVINPDTKKKERIRLLRGVETIWLKEQKDLDKEYINKNRRSLRFEAGVCILEPTDSAGIKFSEISNNSADNPSAIPGKKHRFFKWNPLAQEKAALEKEKLEIQAMQLAMAQPYDKVKKHAAFLGGISFVDQMGEARSEDGIRTLYIIKAKQNPKRFMETIESKEVEVAYLIKKAIMDSKIDLGGASGSVKWANGGYICKLPKGRTPHEYLLELALLPNDEGKTFLEHLQKTI